MTNTIQPLFEDMYVESLDRGNRCNITSDLTWVYFGLPLHAREQPVVYIVLQEDYASITLTMWYHRVAMDTSAGEISIRHMRASS